MGKKNNSSSSSNKANVNSGTNSKSNPSVNPSEIPEKVPDEFKKVMTDFINDFTTTFPEYSDKLKDNFVVVSVKTDGNVVAEEMLDEGRVQTLYEYSKTVYPARFFDILYKNADIFKKESGDSGAGAGAGAGVNVNFLPDINFREVWNTPDISNNTRDTIWKYLQLILFSIITNISDRDSFGDTAKLFEAINEDELKNKLEETIKNMQDLFMNGADAGGGAGENTGEAGEAGASGENTKFGDGIDMKEFEKFAEQFKNFSPDGMGGIDMSKFPGFSGFPGFNSNNNNEEGGADKGDADNNKKPEMPNPETIHEHISKLLNGKIGALAKEIAEETAKDFDFGIDMENAENINMSNVFQKLFKNPGKLMNMVKNVGAKLDDKFKKGDIKESELMKEASDLLSNMKNMPGMGDLSSMLGKMGMSGLGGLGGLAGLGGKGGKINMGALQSHLQQNMKNAKMKERMQTKLQQKQQQPQTQPSQQKPSPVTHVNPVTPVNPVNPVNNVVRPTTAVYTSSSGEQIQQTPRTAKPVENVIVDIGTGTSTDTGTGYEPVTETQKNKKKKNKNKK
jgi:hypothetical protein